MVFDYEMERGYIIVPRSIDKLPEDLRIIFKYLLSKATYRDRPSRNLEIGQVTITIDQLRDNHKSMNYSKYKMENVIKQLEKMELITWKRGRPNVPSVITITGYKTIQNTINYGLNSLTPDSPQTDPGLTPDSPQKPNRDKDLDDITDPGLTPDSPQTDPGLTPLELITHNASIQNTKEEEESSDSTTSLRDELVAIYKKLSETGYIANNRKYQKTKKDLQIIEDLLKEYSAKEIRLYWNRFCSIPGDYYIDRPITLPLFKAAVGDDYAIVEIDPKVAWEKLKRQFESKRSVK